MQRSAAVGVAQSQTVLLEENDSFPSTLINSQAIILEQRAGGAKLAWERALQIKQKWQRESVND